MSTTISVSNSAVGQATFGAFYVDNYAALAVVAGTAMCDRSVGEEIAHEALTKASERWELVATRDMPGAWVRRVALTLALSHRRRRSDEKTAWERVVRQRAVEHRAGSPAVWAAVDQLPPRQRAVVAMHYLEDRSVSSIADVLEVTVSAATSHLHKARANLAATLRGAAMNVDTLVTRTFQAEREAVGNRRRVGGAPSVQPIEIVAAPTRGRWRSLPLARAAVLVLLVAVVGVATFSLVQQGTPTNVLAVAPEVEVEVEVEVDDGAVQQVTDWAIGSREDTVAVALTRAPQTRAPQTRAPQTRAPQAIRPAPSQAQPQFVQGPEVRLCVTGIVAPDMLNLRGGPGTAFTVVAEMPQDSCAVFDTAVPAQNGWRRVRFESPRGELIGWASGRYLSVAAAAPPVPVPAANS